MGEKRVSRNERRRRTVELTSRDEELLNALNRFRLARTSDLRQLVFADRSAGRCAERLRQLFHARYLEVRLGRLSEENVYSVGPKGRHWLEEREIAIGRLPSGGIAHHLAIVSSWVGLAAALRGSGQGFHLRQFRADWELRQQQHRLRLPVVPDGLAELTTPDGGALHVALEVDLATERHAALRKKLEGYRQLTWMARQQWGWGELMLALLVWSGGPRREQSVGRLLQRSWPHTSVLASRANWPNALFDALPPLTTPADGKRGGSNGSAMSSTASLDAEAELSPNEMAGSGVDS